MSHSRLFGDIEENVDLGQLQQQRTFSMDLNAGAGSRGGGGAMVPWPRPFSGEKNKGAKNHRHRKQMIKIGQPRSKIQAKSTPKQTKYAKIF